MIPSSNILILAINECDGISRGILLYIKQYSDEK